jgi:hypothetical protein
MLADLDCAGVDNLPLNDIQTLEFASDAAARIKKGANLLDWFAVGAGFDVGVRQALEVANDKKCKLYQNAFHQWMILHPWTGEENFDKTTRKHAIWLHDHKAEVEAFLKAGFDTHKRQKMNHPTTVRRAYDKVYNPKKKKEKEPEQEMGVITEEELQALYKERDALKREVAQLQKLIDEREWTAKDEPQPKEEETPPEIDEESLDKIYVTTALPMFLHNKKDEDELEQALDLVAFATLFPDNYMDMIKRCAVGRPYDDIDFEYVKKLLEMGQSAVDQPKTKEAMIDRIFRAACLDQELKTEDYYIPDDESINSTEYSPAKLWALDLVAFKTLFPDEYDNVLRRHEVNLEYAKDLLEFGQRVKKAEEANETTPIVHPELKITEENKVGYYSVGEWNGFKVQFHMFWGEPNTSWSIQAPSARTNYAPTLEKAVENAKKAIALRVKKLTKVENYKKANALRMKKLTKEGSTI